MGQIGVTSECVTSMESPDSCAAALRQFEAREIRQVTTVRKLREGWNSRSAEVIIMLDPTVSILAYMQMIGRILRPGKVALVIDALYQNLEYESVNAPFLFGMPGQEIVNGGILLAPKPSNTNGNQVVSPYLDAAKAQVVLTIPYVPLRGDEHGLALHCGAQYATFMGLIHLLAIGYATLDDELPKVKLETESGYDYKGRPAVFYHVETARKKFAHLLVDANIARDDVLVIIEREWWGTERVIAEVLGTYVSKIEVASCRIGTPRRRGLVGEMPHNFFPLMQIAKTLGITPPLVLAPLEPDDVAVEVVDADDVEVSQENVQPQKDATADKSDTVTEAKQEVPATDEVVEEPKDNGSEILDDNIKAEVVPVVSRPEIALPEARSNGCIYRGRGLYAPLTLAADLLSQTKKFVEGLVIHGPVTSIEGYDRRGRVRTFYSISNLEQVMKHLNRLKP